MRHVLLVLYCASCWVLLAHICLAPKAALAVQYSRVITRGAQLAYLAANRAALISTVAPSAGLAIAGAKAMRFIPGPVGWAAFGVSAAVTLAELYYSQSDLQTIKTNATPPAASIPTPGMGQLSNIQSCPGNGGCQPGYDAVVTIVWNPDPSHQYADCPPNWEGAGGVPETNGTQAYCLHFAGQPNAAVFGSGTVTQQNIQDYLQSLPAANPLSVESHTVPVGVGNAPTPAEQVTTVPVSPSDLPSEVVPEPVPPGSIVVAQNVPPPGGTQTTTTTQQTTTTQTTTTTNPDGSTTQQEETEATTSCAVGTHEGRTFGSVLEAHQALWTSSGLLSALTLLKSLTWPTTLPIVSLPSTFFGTQQVDFNQWSWFFVVLRSLVIAMASLGAYRIIFVGGRS